ncbi:hypothetical protein EVAR_71601_1 [Eumeta japonica]|uniref:Uncharacterized protein n=1 Tax=Eumeta variegata TaxID=151549 RepID=A0A4C1TQ64_EUMVA|nr:hypothetical protein EVAR_71601_1 [Eumeta japonica]
MEQQHKNNVEDDDNDDDDDDDHVTRYSCAIAKKDTMMNASMADCIEHPPNCHEALGTFPAISSHCFCR